MAEIPSGRIAEVLEGARRFREREVPRRAAQLAELAKGQHPAALFIACSDSRVVPELITQSDPGGIFVCRNIGNIVPPHGAAPGDVAAVVEYAVVALGVADIIVCGHSECGAMKALCDPAQSHAGPMPAVGSWLHHAAEALAAVRARGEDLPQPALVQAVVEQNVLVQLAHLRTHPAVASRLATGVVALHGWVYGLSDGSIFVFDAARDAFVPIEQSS